MASMFKKEVDMQRVVGEVVPFYDRSLSVEQSILSFLQHPPPSNKAKIMTLFEPTGTGKTTIISNIPKLFTNIYQVTIHPSMAGYIRNSVTRWHRFFGAVEECLSEFSPTSKNIAVETVKQQTPEIPFLSLSPAVEKVLGKDALLFLHLDECQLVMNQEFLRVLYSLVPCSNNVKMIFTGTTALGNDEIKGMGEFESIACPPLPPFTAERVRKVLNNVLYWEELQVQDQTSEQTSEIKRKIEEELQGRPKNTLYFLQELSKKSSSITKQLLQDTLDGAYYIYRTKQKKMLDQLINVNGKQSFENEALFEKLVMIFSFPNEFKLEKNRNGILTGSISNGIIKYLLPFNHSGLVRINRVDENTISITIPDNFTLRYIREKTLYFPKEWLNNFNSSCINVDSNVSSSVKGCCVQIWLAIMLLNQHSTLSAHVQHIIKDKRGLSCLKINSDKKNYSTFEGRPEAVNVAEPMIAKDGGDNSCVDVVIPFSAVDSDNQIDEFNLVVQITCRKDPTPKAKSFFDRILKFACNKSDDLKRSCYRPFIALFVTVHPLAHHGADIQSVNNQLEQNSDLLLLQLCNIPEVFPGLKLLQITEDMTLMQEWIKNSNTFLNIDSGNMSQERQGAGLSDKHISPYGNSHKKQKTENQHTGIVPSTPSNVGSTIGELERVGALFEKGLIDKDEYQWLKKNILGNMK